MTLSYDPIPVFEAAGYTEREAAFLYLAALHSGYFLRRQYVRFIQRSRGALAEQFLRRAFALGHIESIACEKGRFVYHITSTLVYSTAGLGDSHHRRLKSDGYIKSRLMILDFVLDHLDADMLDTASSKVTYFTDIRQLSESLLPRSRGSFFAEEFPVIIGTNDTPRFTYCDEGSLSTSAFEHFLARYRSLFLALPRFELIYVADSAQNAERARTFFAAKFSALGALGTSPLAPRGVDHLLDYAAAHARISSPAETPTLRDLAVIREGRNLYTHVEHLRLFSEYESGHIDAERIRRRITGGNDSAAFVPAILPYTYPLQRAGRENQPKPEHGSSERSVSALPFDS